MLKRLPILDLQTRTMSNLFLYDLLFSELNLLLPSLRAIEFLIIFTEIEASIVQTFVEVFSCYFITYFLEFGTTASKFCQFLFKPWNHNRFSHLSRSTFDHQTDYIRRIDVGEYLLSQRVIQFLSALNQFYDCLQRSQVRINLVLFFLVLQKLLFKLIFTSNNETSLSTQRN